jgi:pre-rRNA-processing protein IPI1
MYAWYLAPSFAKHEAFVSFEELLQPTQQHSSDSDCRTWQAEVDLGDDDFTHHHIFSICHQPYLDTVLDDVGIAEDGSGINYTFIAVWFFSCNWRSISDFSDISI